MGLQVEIDLKKVAHTITDFGDGLVLVRIADQNFCLTGCGGFAYRKVSYRGTLLASTEKWAAAHKIELLLVD